MEIIKFGMENRELIERQIQNSIKTDKMNKLKEYLESNSDDELIYRIKFDFDDVIPFDGWLPAHLSIGSELVEIALNTCDLKKAGIEIDSNVELRKFALEQFKQFSNQNP